eukprot:1823681-Pyramimonas_sp.AAC.1
MPAHMCTHGYGMMYETIKTPHERQACLSTPVPSRPGSRDPVDTRCDGCAPRGASAQRRSVHMESRPM